jgi:hypothetical protein
MVKKEIKITKMDIIKGLFYYIIILSLIITAILTTISTIDRAVELKNKMDDSSKLLKPSDSDDFILVTGPLRPDGDVWSNFSYGGALTQAEALNISNIGDQYTDDYYIWCSTNRYGVWNFENKSFSDVYAENFTRVYFHIIAKPASSGVFTISFTVNNITLGSTELDFVENEIYSHKVIAIDYDIPVEEYNQTQFGLYGSNSIQNNCKFGAYWIELTSTVSEVELIQSILISKLRKKTKKIQLPPGLEEFWNAYGAIIISAIVAFAAALGQTYRKLLIERNKKPGLISVIREWWEKRFG